MDFCNSLCTAIGTRVVHEQNFVRHFTRFHAIQCLQKHVAAVVRRDDKADARFAHGYAAFASFARPINVHGLAGLKSFFDVFFGGNCHFAKSRALSSSPLAMSMARRSSETSS